MSEYTFIDGKFYRVQIDGGLEELEKEDIQEVTTEYLEGKVDLDGKWAGEHPAYALGKWRGRAAEAITKAAKKWVMENGNEKQKIQWGLATPKVSPGVPTLSQALKRKGEPSETKTKKKKANRTGRSVNFSKNLKVIVEQMVATMKALGMTQAERRINQNAESVFRVVMLAENDRQRVSRDKAQTLVNEATVNVLKMDGSIEAKTVQLDELKSEFRARFLETEEFELPAGSKMNSRSLMYAAIAFVARTVNVSDKMYAPGRGNVTARGMPPQTTTLTNGSGVPGRFASHNRRVQGAWNDYMGLLAAKDSGRQRSGTGKPVFDVIQENLARRQTNPRLRALVQSMNRGMTRAELEEAIKVGMMGSLVFPARETRAFLPPMGVLVDALENGERIDEMDFLADAREAAGMIERKGVFYGMQDGVTEESELATHVVMNMYASVFLSSDLIRKTSKKAATRRQQIRSKTMRIKTGDQTTTYKVKHINPEIKKIQKREEAEQGMQSGSWQINAQDAYGASSADRMAVVAGITGKGKGSGSAARSVAKIAKLIVRDIKEETGELLITMVDLTTGEETISASGSLGFFGEAGEAEKISEKIGNKVGAYQMERDESESEDSDEDDI